MVAVEMVGKCNGHAAAEMSGARTRPADRLASASVWSRLRFIFADVLNLGLCAWGNVDVPAGAWARVR